MTAETTSTAADQTIDGELFVVLRNDEDQYSLWPAAKAAPAGWTLARAAATKADSLAFIEDVWTDMRPRRLREAIDRDPL